MTSPEIAEWITAVSTLALTATIVTAIVQLNQERRNSSVERTLPIMHEWNRGRIQHWLYYTDYDQDLDKARRRTNRLYRIARPARMVKIANFLVNIARLAERTEILFRRELIDRDIFAEHLGYDILSAYYSLQDILAKLAEERDLHFLGFYRLAISLQPYYRNLPDEEVIDQLADCTFIKPEM